MNEQPGGATPRPEAMPGGSSARSDIVGGAAWIAFGALIVAGSLHMDRFEKMGATLYTMPGFVPGMVGILLMLLGAVLTLRGWSRRGAASGAPVQALLNRRALWTAALALVYAGLLIGRVHFLLATCAFVAAFVWLFTPEGTSPRRRWLAALVAGVLTALLVDLVFEDLFLVRLP